MLKVHLKEVLNEHGYTLYDLSDAILDLEGISESTVYRFGRGGQNLTLKKLELILKAVRSLTGQPIRLSDLISDEEQVIPSGSAGGDAPSKTLVLLSPREPEQDIDEVWALVAQRVGQRAPKQQVRGWSVASVGALAILGLVLLGSADWTFSPDLPAVDPTGEPEVTTLSAKATGSHVGALPAVHMELKELDSSGEAVGRPVCEVYNTPAHTRPRLTECPSGKYKEQLFDKNWALIDHRDVVVGAQLGNR